MFVLYFEGIGSSNAILDLQDRSSKKFNDFGLDLDVYRSVVVFFGGLRDYDPKNIKCY